MNKPLKLTLLILPALALIATLWYLFTPTEIQYHNARLRAAIQDAPPLELRTLHRPPDSGPSYTPKIVRLTNKPAIAQLLSLFLIPETAPSKGFHACMGHIQLSFSLGSDSYHFQYDHNSTIYAIQKPGHHSSGAIPLDPATITQLHTLLTHLGFTDEDLGISPPAPATTISTTPPPLPI